MKWQLVKSECTPVNQATNGLDVTTQHICNSARGKELISNSTRGQQMESPSSNILRSSGQKLNNDGMKNIAKQGTEEVKEEELDDYLNTGVRGENPVLCPQVNEVDVYTRCTNISEDTETLVASPQLFVAINDQLKIIAGVQEFRSKVEFEPPEENRLERNDDTDLIGNVSVDVDGILLTLFGQERFGNTSKRTVRNKEQSSESDKLSCLDCPAVFKTKKEFKKHISTHDDYRGHQCSHCDRRFKGKHLLHSHERIHSGEKSFKCPTCDESFTSKLQCIEHQRKHTGDRPFTCEDCGKTFARKGSYLAHGKIHTGDKIHSCEFCGWKFIQSHSLKLHLRTHKGVKPYRCLICKTRFSALKRWKLHVEKHHKEEYEEYAVGRIQRKSTKKPYMCDVCGGSFRSPSALTIHKRTHTGEKPYKCNFCDKGLSTPHTFKSHLFTHSGRKPYLCIVCKIQFPTRTEMVSHKQQSHGNGTETVNVDQVAKIGAVPDTSSAQEHNPINIVSTSGKNNEDGALVNSTAFIEVSTEMNIDSYIMQITDVNSAQGGSSVRKRNASDGEEAHPILVKTPTKNTGEISTNHAGPFEENEPSFLHNGTFCPNNDVFFCAEITTDPYPSVPYEQVDDTSTMEESQASELAASPRILYKRRSMEHIVAKAARKNPHILYIVWSENFFLDVAEVVSRHESNCVLFVQNFLPSSLSDVFSLSQDFKLQTPKVNVGILSEPLYCFDFGDIGLPMKISKESAFESFAKVESKMKKFARTKGMELVNILRRPKDAHSWCNHILQQMKGRCIVSNSA